MRFRVLPVLIALALLLAVALPEGAQEPKGELRLTLRGVPLSSDYARADRALARELGTVLGVEVEHNDKFNTYGELIDSVTIPDKPYLARMTPYAFLAAEMLGARMEVLGTYESLATNTTTYQSYFVVNASAFEGQDTLEDIYEYLRRRPSAARFVYHDKFSTSSYLLPALWFRSHRVFATGLQASDVLRVELQMSASSSQSLDKVAAKEAELAAVWDGTRSNYDEKKKAALRFIPLSLKAPNDLLVVSESVDAKTKASIRTAIEGLVIGIGDFKRWRSIDNAREALDALNALKRLARAAPAPVVVSVDADTRNVSGDTAGQLVEAARQAIRLSGTEFVLHEPTFHEAVDVKWTLRWVHDGAVLLTSEIQLPETSAQERLKQEFHISFTTDEGDLTRRIVALIHSRLHRVRYIWPYQDTVPTVIRDIDFAVPEGGQLTVQRLTWRDPDRNSFVSVRAGVFSAKATKPTGATFEFDKQAFPTNNGTVDFQNPLSDVAYRVFLERRSNESTMSKVLAGTFVGLLLLTALGAAVDLRRRLIPSTPRPPRTLTDVCGELAARLHDTWKRPLTDADVRFCDRTRVEQQIEELKSRGLVPVSMGGITRWAYSVTAGASIPFIRAFTGEASRHAELVLDPKTVGDTVRLSALLDLMIQKRLLSLFVGQPLEWDALNELARNVLPGAATGEFIIRREDETVMKIASRHFGQVINDALRNLSLLRGSWTLSKRDGRCLAQQRTLLPGPITINNKLVSAIHLEFNVQDDVELPMHAVTGTIDCWVLGKVVARTISEEAGARALCLHLRTFAILLAVDETMGSGPVVSRYARDVGAPAEIGG